MPAEAVRLAVSYETPGVARELVEATLAMIGGQQLDLAGSGDLAVLHGLKTGALFTASIMCGLQAAGLPAAEHPPWRAFARELGLLFQVVDDILDGDGYVLEVGEEAARGLADDATGRAQARLAEIAADTSVLAAQRGNAIEPELAAVGAGLTSEAACRSGHPMRRSMPSKSMTR